jgi:hypothetical protein
MDERTERVTGDWMEETGVIQYLLEKTKEPHTEVNKCNQYMNRVKVNGEIVFARHDDVSVLPPFLSSSVGRSELPASFLGCLYSQRNNPWYPINSTVGGPYGGSKRFVSERISSSPPGFETWIIQSVI